MVASSGSISKQANTEVTSPLPDVMTVPLTRVAELTASVLNFHSVLASALYISAHIFTTPSAGELELGIWSTDDVAVPQPCRVTNT